MHLHPALVHFPLAMLPLAAMLYALSVRQPHRWWNEGAAFLHLGGVAGLALAIFSGQWEESALTLSPEADTVAGRHEILGWFNLWTFGLLALWRALAGKRFSAVQQAVFLLLFFLSLLGLIASGYLGGQLVFVHGAGVQGNG